MTGNRKGISDCFNLLFQFCDESRTNWEPTEDECQANVGPIYT